MYNNLRYFIITEAAYEAAMPSPLKDNYPMYEEDGETPKTSYTWKEFNESKPSMMWCYPKPMDYGDGEVTMWVGKENQAELWSDEDVEAINAIEGCKTLTHQEVLAELSNYLVTPEIV